MGSKFQNSVYQELKAYRGSAQSLPLLSDLDAATKDAAGDHGLDNFNRDDPVQVLIRTLNESSQQTLESINLIGKLCSFSLEIFSHYLPIALHSLLRTGTRSYPRSHRLRHQVHCRQHTQRLSNPARRSPQQP